jgi:hypothetical protein
MMDVVSRLPGRKRGNDVIWVILDQLTKYVLFFPIKMTNSVDKLTGLYMNEVVRLQGFFLSRPSVHISIVAKYPACSRDKVEFQYCISSING